MLHIWQLRSRWHNIGNSKIYANTINYKTKINLVTTVIYKYVRIIEMIPSASVSQQSGRLFPGSLLPPLHTLFHHSKTSPPTDNQTLHTCGPATSLTHIPCVQPSPLTSLSSPHASALYSCQVMLQVSACLSIRTV
jgi:hypothetical protein